MLASFLLSFREGLEAALMISILLAALRKIGQNHLNSFIWRGVFAAVCVSLLAGSALVWLGAELEGHAEEIFEGIAMLSAAVLLTWVIFWMGRHAATLREKLETDVQKASISQGNRWALFGLSFLAIGREGFELVLFLTAVRLATDMVQTLLGALLGLAGAVALGWILFTSSKRLNLSQFFKLTSLLLVLVAAGLVGHGIHELNEAGIIPPIMEHVWDINPILNEKHLLGQLLTALFGYNANPSLTEVLAYIAYFFGVGLLLRGSRRPASSTQIA